MSYPGIIISFVLVNNILLSEILGLSPVFGASRRLDSSVALGTAVTIVSTVTAIAAWVLDSLVLQPLGIGFLRVMVAVFTAAAAAHGIDWLFFRVLPRLHRSFGAFFPLVAANSAVVGIVLIILRGSYGPVESVVAGASAGAGALLAMVLLQLLREKLESERVPRIFRGTPITLITAGLMAMAFLAFDKSFLARLFG